MKMIRDQKRSSRKRFVPSSIFQSEDILDLVPPRISGLIISTVLISEFGEHGQAAETDVIKMKSWTRTLNFRKFAGTVMTRTKRGHLCRL